MTVAQIIIAAWFAASLASGAVLAVVGSLRKQARERCDAGTAEADGAGLSHREYR